jgi:hypothetical protein
VTAAVHTGGCLCGALRYRASGKPRVVVNCHCSLCRRAAGAPFVTWATFPIARFRFTAGEPGRFRATAPAERTFCPRCGTPLTFFDDRRPAELDVTVCSFDKPERFPPDRHIFVANRVAWAHLDDGLAQHAAFAVAPKPTNG